jgi:hypothetical protein
MILIVRKFHPHPGGGAALIDALQTRATGIIQARQAEAVMLCEDTGVSGHVVWIETRASDPRPDDWTEPAAPGGDGGEHCPPEPLEFLDGFYRFPAPPCQVWSLEVRTAAPSRLPAMREFLRVVRQAATDSAIGGVSLYRSLRDPALLVAFVALPPGLSPARLLLEMEQPRADADRAAVTVAWTTLVVRWTLGRLPSARGSLVSPTTYPATAFWGRWGLAAGVPRVGAAGAGLARGGDLPME